MDDYVFDLEADAPWNIIQAGTGDMFSCEFRVGFLMDTEEAVVMSATLLEGAGFVDGYDGIFDLRFGFRTKCLHHDWKVSGLDFERSSVLRYVPKPDRQHVFVMLLRAVRAVVDDVRPRVITMSTYDVELPPAALVKYRAIEMCLHGLGYVTSATYRSPSGHDRWHLEE